MSGSLRKSKWKRVKNPDAVVLQPRDKEIIKMTYEFELLSREQIQSFFNFGCAVRANLRLRKLFDTGYLSRRFLPTVKGSAKALYVLGPQGIQVIAEETGDDPLYIRKKREAILNKKDLFFTHDLMVNSVRLYFYQAFNTTRDLSLELWMTAADWPLRGGAYDRKPNRELKIIFRPDGYFRYIQNNKLFSCFLEVDRSTMSNNRFLKKIALYIKYAQAGFHQQKFGLKFFRVLIVTKTKERMRNLKAITSKATNKIFWFATFEDLSSENILGASWERPGTDGKLSLVEKEQ